MSNKNAEKHVGTLQEDVQKQRMEDWLELTKLIRTNEAARRAFARILRNESRFASALSQILTRDGWFLWISPGRDRYDA